MDKQMQEAPRSFRGRMFSRNNTKRRETQTLVLKTGIAGAQHHIESAEEKKRLDELQPGTELKLYREPENEYDEWAIAVYITEDDKIGYISRFKNETIARLMDAGKKFIAIVDDPAEEAIKKKKSDYKNYKKAATEDMTIPFSVYLVEEG